MKRPKGKGREVLPLSVVQTAQAGDAEARSGFCGTMKATYASCVPGNSMTRTAAPICAWTST